MHSFCFRSATNDWDKHLLYDFTGMCIFQFYPKNIFQKLQKRQKNENMLKMHHSPQKRKNIKNRQNKILSLFQIQFKCNNIKWAKSTHAWSLTKCEQISVEIIEWIAFWIFLFVECSFSRVWPLRCTGTLWLLLLLSCT